MLAAPLILPFCLDALPEMGARISEAAAWRDQYQLKPLSLAMNFGLPWFAEVHSGFYSSFFACLMILISIPLLFKKSIFSSDEKFHLRFFMIFFVFCVLYSFGSTLFFNAWIQEILFVLKFTRTPGRVMILGVFCMGAIVSLVYKALTVEKMLPKRNILALVGISAAVMLLPLILFILIGSSSIEPYAPLNITANPGMAHDQVMFFLVFGISSAAIGCGLFAFRNGKIHAVLFFCLLVVILAEAFVYYPKGTWYARGVPADTQLCSYECFSEANTLYGRNPLLSEPGFISPVLLPSIEPNPDAPKIITDYLLRGGMSAGLLWMSEGRSRLYNKEKRYRSKNCTTKC
jgi:hypothetical protein